MNLKNTKGKSRRRLACISVVIVIALLITPLIGFGATQDQNVTEQDQNITLPMPENTSIPTIPENVTTSENVTEGNETQPEPGNITDRTAPIIMISEPDNITYNTTLGIGLNYTIDEPTGWVGYSLNGASNVTISGNITFNAIAGLNELVVYARDIAGNSAMAEVQFTVDVNITNITDVNITNRAPIFTIIPDQTFYENTNMTINLSLYCSDPDNDELVYTAIGPENITVLIEDELVTLIPDVNFTGKRQIQFVANDSEYSVYSNNVTIIVKNVTIEITPKLSAKKDSFSLDDEPEFIFEYAAEKKMLEEVAALGEPRKAVKKWITANETIETFVYDSSGKLTDIEPEIEKIEEGKFSIKLPKERAFRAGLYTLSVELVKDEQVFVVEKEFPWGLVSLNTRKSIYKPGESAEFVIVVLDKDGHSVCGADISMTVTNPGNEKTVYRTGDGTILPGEECGIYNADYPTGVEGNHTINITAMISGVEVAFETYFSVLQNYAFDIVRTAQSKIDPTKQDRFYVRIDIESFTDATSLTIKEFVPAEFEISTTDAASVLVEDDTRTITWNKELFDGKTSVSYSYSVPHVWPYLYALGPAELDYDTKSFKEARSWYVAVDPVYSSTPTAENNTVVSTTSTTYTTLKTLTITKSGQTWLKTDHEIKPYLYLFTAEPAENTESREKYLLSYFIISALSVISAVNKYPYPLIRTAYVKIVATNNTSIYCEDSSRYIANYITFSRELDISSLTDGSQSFDLQMKISAAHCHHASYNRNWKLYLENLPPKVETPKTYDNITLGGKTIFHRNDGMTVRVNVTDADGASDLSKVLIKILNTTNAVKVDNATMTNITGITKGYTYEYNYTIPSDADYGTWTINVYANDTVNNWGSNTTTFDVYGYSNVTWISPPEGSSYTVGETITLTCLVRDANTSSPIENYPVHFYNRTDSTVTYDFGLNYTNSSGYAIINWATAGVSPGWYYPKGNITDNATLFYNISAPYEANTSIKLSLATTLELRNQTASQGITSINVSGESGNTVKDPYNNVDGSGSPQNITNRIPVVTIYNPASSTNYRIWLKVTAGTGWDYIISDEKFNVTADATDPGDVNTWISLKPWGTLVDTGVTVAQGTYKDLYLAFQLKRSGTGTATISVLGEVV